MNPISPVNVQWTRASELISGRSPLAGACGNNLATAAGPTASLSLSAGSAISGAQVSTQVAQLLASLGSDMETDKVLRTLLALLILMALSSKSQETNTQTADLLEGLSRGMNRASSYGAGAPITTTFEFYQSQKWSVTTLQLVNGQDTPAQSPTLGLHLDSTA